MILVSKRVLLTTAFTVWMFGGSILITRGLYFTFETNNNTIVKLTTAIIGATLFYTLLFNKISNKHIFRIKQLDGEKVPFYSFFDTKSYIMMPFMIILGIGLRKSGFVNIEYLAVFYMVMGLPLAISALKFLYNAVLYK